MNENLFITGFLSGLSVAIPIGPIGLVCLHRTLNKNRAAGLVSGLGIATADAVYGGIAGLGLVVIDNIIARHGGWLYILPLIICCYFGFRIISSRKLINKINKEDNNIFRFYISAFLATLANPTIILGFIAVFALLRLIRGPMSPPSFILLTLAVFSGSAAWWIILTSLVNALRHKLSFHGLYKFNYILGGAVIGLGVAAFFIIK